jgi:hypothetical protein
MKRLFLVLFFTVVMVSPVNAQSTLVLQEKCAEGAKKFFLDCGGYSSRSEDSSITCNYTSHYNKKLDKCFIRINCVTLHLKHKEGELGEANTLCFQVIDIFKRKLHGEYETLPVFSRCEVGNKKCDSLEEFETLIKPYMEE